MKKNHYYSGGKNSKQRSNKISKEGKKEKKIKLLYSSSKHIRTHHKLIKNNHQLAFNQSMEMPRKTCIFQNKIYITRSKKSENDIKINSNRSQRGGKNNYKYILNKNSNKQLNESNIESDKIYRDDNLFNDKKYTEKKNKFKILNNSEIQTKKKNNSQSNLLHYNIKKKYPSAKLIVNNSKKNILSNYSNGKNDKLCPNIINNNINTNHRDNKTIRNNLNCYYSNVKINKKDNKNSYNNSNCDINKNNSTIKKEYDISREQKDIINNLSFITITDSYLNTQKKNLLNDENNNKINNIKIEDNYLKNNKYNNDNQKDIDCFQIKKNNAKKRLSHIKYNSCINTKINNFHLYDEKANGLKKEINISHKIKHEKDINNKNNMNKNYH